MVANGEGVGEMGEIENRFLKTPSHKCAKNNQEQSVMVNGWEII